jgi:hypothetical protein
MSNQKKNKIFFSKKKKKCKTNIFVFLLVVVGAKTKRAAFYFQPATQQTDGRTEGGMSLNRLYFWLK